MTAAADLILTNAEVHTLTEPDVAADAASRERASRHADEIYEAVAVRDGEIVRVDSAYEVAFLEGVETRVLDLDGRVVLPGFVDAHTHLQTLGRYLVHADLRGADGPDDCVERLRESASERETEDGEARPEGAPRDERAGDAREHWILGFGFDESAWAESRYLRRGDLDRVSEDRPVAAFREDMHVASVNSVALDRFRAEMPDGDVETEGGEPTGVLVEEAVDVVYRDIEPDAEGVRDLLAAAQREANRLGVTGVHDMVRRTRAPEVYREMDLADELTVRVRLNYWSDHLDAAIETGLRTNHGSGMVRTGAIKTYTDGSLGGRTAKLSEPYADSEARSASGSRDSERSGDDDGTGQWVVPPDELRELVRRADDAGFQMCAHAIGDEAVDAVLDAYEAEADDPGAARHRVEHAELASDRAIERFADLGVVASMQPNFLKWADDDGLYESRLGTDRRLASNRLPAYLAAGAPLAFGSDCMPLDPLLGVHHAVNAPAEGQRLSVTDALRAYTLGAAYAGFDEDRLGTVETGKRADLVALDRSPWDDPGGIRDVDVALTVVDGDVVYDGRND
jgi:predicted amidohydrolase YtcJ